MQGAFELCGRVEAVLVATDLASIVSNQAKKIQMIRGHGVRGDRHVGTRLADVREGDLIEFGLPKGIEVANFREFSAVTVEELHEIARLMGLPRAIPYGLLGENIVLSGVPLLTELPIGTKFFFQKNPATKRTAVLVVWGENTPCLLPGEVIEKHFPDIPNLASRFPKCALGKRGVVGSVYSSGFIHEGDTVIVKVPRQKIYAPFQKERS